MEKLKMRYQSLLEAYNSLGQTVQIIKKEKSTDSEILHDIYRDSLIKRFEFTYDLTWKYLKYYLEKYHGIIANSPKSVFHECLGQNIVNQNAVRILLNMVDDRNLTSHTYNEEIADQIALRILKYYDFLHTFIQEIKPK